MRRPRRGGPPPGGVLSHSPVPSHADVKPSGRLAIGRGVRIAGGFGLAAYGEIIIEDDVVIGPYVQVLDSDLHEAGAHGRLPEPRPVRIGRGARIGAWSTLLPGTDLGPGAEVKPHSVVVGVVPAGIVVAGNPATAVGAGPSPGVGRTPFEVVAAALVATFGLREPPDPQAARESIDGWSSLGALRLLDALNRSTGRTLPTEDVLAARSVAELADVVRGHGGIGT